MLELSYLINGIQGGLIVLVLEYFKAEEGEVARSTKNSSDREVIYKSIHQLILMGSLAGENLDDNFCFLKFCVLEF